MNCCSLMRRMNTASGSLGEPLNRCARRRQPTRQRRYRRRRIRHREGGDRGTDFTIDGAEQRRRAAGAGRPSAVKISGMEVSMPSNKLFSVRSGYQPSRFALRLGLAVAPSRAWERRREAGDYRRRARAGSYRRRGYSGRRRRSRSGRRRSSRSGRRRRGRSGRRRRGRSGRRRRGRSGRRRRGRLRPKAAQSFRSKAARSFRSKAARSFRSKAARSFR